jgi:hypothetical protein
LGFAVGRVHDTFLPCSQINQELDEFVASSFFRYFRARLQSHLDDSGVEDKSVSAVVCLGLGHFLSCPISRTQLVLLLSLRRELCSPAAVSAYDPVFSDLERQLLREEWEVEVDDRNVEGKVRVASSGVTLFFLPHCPKQLTNNLLWSNWSAEALARTFLVCNSVSRLQESLPGRVLAKEVRFLDLCADFSSETQLLPPTEAFGFSDVFNDLSLHSFPIVPAEDWPHWAETDAAEPTYKDVDVEYIRNDVHQDQSGHPARAPERDQAGATGRQAVGQQQQQPGREARAGPVQAPPGH